MQRSCARSVQLCQCLRSFSTTSALQARRPKSHPPLPVPSTQTPKVIVPDSHALWGFFRDRKTLTPPKEDAKHGRAWTAEELRRKSFDDLHSLWIICLKERNILATQRHERRRQRIRTTGNEEAATRDRTVRRTMAGIKFVLNERFLAYQQAVELAQEDKSIDLSSAAPRLEANQLSAQERKVLDQPSTPKKTGVARKADELFKIKAARLARERQSVPATA